MAPKPRPTTDERWRFALLVGGAHFAFDLLLQAEAFLRFVLPGFEGPGAALRTAALLPFAQLEHLAVAALLGVVAWGCRGRPWLEPIPHVLLLVANLHLAVDQLAYGLFRDHLSPLLAEPGAAGAVSPWRPLLGSAAAEVDPAFVANAALALGLGGAVLAASRRGPDRESRPRPLGAPRAGRAGVLLFLAWLVAAVPATWGADLQNLERHPAVALLLGVVRAPSEPPPPPAVELEELLRASRDPAEAAASGARSAEVGADSGAEPGADSGAVDPAVVRREDAALTRARDALRALSRPGRSPGGAPGRPHLLLVVLESVGSEQLFPGGEPSPERTPHLAARLARGSVLFTSLYAPFPGTVRSHAALATGGLTVTWSSVYEELELPFRGPTLPRVLAELGYRTAVVSAGELSFENLDGLYDALGYDRVFDPGSQPAKWRERHRIHSWGVAEEAVTPRVAEWLAASEEPALAQLLTISSHHPYGAPGDHRSPFEGDGRKARYLQSLHYQDAVLEELFRDLEARGVLEETVVLLTGDHGQAFGERHPGNLTHRNRLYEENVRSFLAVLAPGALPDALDGPVVSGRVGSLGDVLPTVLDLLGTEPPDVPGRSLFPPAYRPRTAYFHKNAHPEQWGLRDGRWKLIARRSGEKRFELYDLEEDPAERRNLAHRHRDLVREYDRRCALWYAAMNRAYLAHLEGYEPPAGGVLDPGEVTSFGPKRLEVGVSEAQAGGRFVRRERLAPGERPAAWTLWVAFPEERTILYEWTSPGGETTPALFRLSPDWSRTVVEYPGPLPLEPGRWRLTLSDGDGELLTAGFTVDGGAFSGGAGRSRPPPG